MPGELTWPDKPFFNDHATSLMYLRNDLFMGKSIDLNNSLKVLIQRTNKVIFLEIANEWLDYG